MSRVQLALDVDDLEVAVDFYSKLFATPPARRRPGYANFAIADPPLKLVLFERPGRGGSLNHLGVEVSSAADVAAARERLAGAGLATASEEGVSCCYARQDKVWVSGPSNVPWEVYTVLEDVGPEPGPGPEDATAAAGSCCGVAEAAAGDEASAAVRAPACC